MRRLIFHTRYLNVVKSSTVIRHCTCWLGQLAYFQGVLHKIYAGLSSSVFFRMYVNSINRPSSSTNLSESPKSIFRVILHTSRGCDAHALCKRITMSCVWNSQRRHQELLISTTGATQRMTQASSCKSSSFVMLLFMPPGPF